MVKYKYYVAYSVSSEIYENILDYKYADGEFGGYGSSDGGSGW